MEKIVGLKDLRQNMASWASKAQKGESFIVVKQSKPLFKVVPIGEDDGVWEEVIDFTKIKKGGVNINELLARL